MKWLPLPKIAHGIAIYPFNPSTLLSSSTSSRPTSIQTQQQDDASISSTSSLADQHSSQNQEDYSHLTPLEVGDEVFIIEQQGQWYRGYVLSTVEEGKKPNRAPLGCFPRTHVQIKEEIEIDIDESYNVTMRQQPQKRRGDEFFGRPLSDIASAPALPRSFSESWIQQAPTEHFPNRPGSLSDLHLDIEHASSEARHIPPPSLPLARFNQSTITGASEPLVDEIAACISEWNSLLYTYINERRYTTFNAVRDSINYLFQARRQLLDQALSREELVKLRKEIVHRIVICNLDQKQQMIVRHPEKGHLLDATNASLSNIYRMHYKYATLPKSVTNICQTATAAAINNASNTSLNNSNASIVNMECESNLLDDTTNSNVSSPSILAGPNSGSPSLSIPNAPGSQQVNQQPQPTIQQHKGAKFYHLFFELKACIAHFCQPGELTELFFSLYSSTERKFLTEQFNVVLNYNGMPREESQIGKLQTLFVDLSLHDISDDLYMVCHVARFGGMKFNEGKDHFATFGSHTSQLFHPNKHQPFQNRGQSAISATVRRPFGCAVLKLTSLLLPQNQQVQKEGDILDYDMPIYTAVSEATYTTLHEDIIFNNVKEFAKNPRAEMLRVSLRTFYGFLDEVLKTNTALLHNVPHTLRLGFADVAFPNDSRNELYMKLEMGDLSQFSRSRNIQVTMCVRDNKTGEVIEDAISTGSGTKPVSFWESMVMYHEQKPKWGEQIKISIQDVYQWERSHVFITIKHRSSNFSGSPGSNTIGSANTSMSSSSSGGEKIVAIGFVPLFLPPYHRDFIADGSHTICLYKSDRPNPSPKSYLDNTPWCARSTAPSNMMQSTADSKANSRFYRNNNNSKPSHRHTPSTHSLKSANGSFHSTTSHQKSLNLANNNSDVSLPQQALSSSNASINGSSAKLVALRDTVTLSTFLCSNIFTQNKTLVKLLNWRTLVEGFGDGANELLSVLDQFTFVGEMEVVKFLGDIFDALLDILAYQYDELNEQAEGLHDEISDQVLAAIIWLLSIVQDRRFSNFRPVLDVYIENRFSVKENEQPSMSDKETQNHNSRLHETTYESLIKSLSRLCENPGDSAKAKLLRSSIKVWDYLFRFIVRSRLNQQFQENENKRIKSNALFKRELENVFNAITSIMGPNQPNAMIGTQTLTLQHFADILAELHAIFMPTEILDIAVSFVDACAHVTGRLVGFKLFMILSMVKSSTFDDPSVRLDFSKNVLQWVGFWVNSYMATAKDVIFSRQAEQQSIPDNLNTQQTRLPRGQWIENLRLSLTVISELLEKVRKAFGMASSGLTSSCIASPSLSNFSRPTSFATVLGEDDQEYSQPDLCAIMEAALQLLPQLLNAYRDIQRLTIQAIHVASSSPIADNASAGSINNGQFRPASRQSFSLLRERSGSISSASVSNPLSKGVHVAPELLQEIPTNQLHRSPSVVSSAAAGPTHMGSSSTLNTLSTANTAGTVKGIPESAQSKFTVTLQALSTSPCAPFPSTYPFQPSSRAVNNAGTSTASSASPNSANDGLTNDHMAMISTGLLDLTVVILELFYLTPGQQWSAFIRKMYEQNGVEDTAEFLRKVVYTCMGILFGDNVMLLEESSLTVDGMMRCEQDETRGHRKIPDNWFNLNAISHQIVLCHILEPIKSTFDLPDFMPNERAYMEDDGILHEEDEDENSKSRNAIAEQRSTLLLWRIYFVGFLRVVGSPRVELTEFMPQAQRAAWKIMGNMRGEVGANVFLSLWNLAGKARLNHEPIKSAALPQTQTDYFGPEFSLPSLTSHSPFSSVILEHGYFDDSLRKSMASIEEDYENEYNTNRNSHVSSTPSNSTYSVRHSVRIGPTDELPLSSIHEERLNDDGIIKSDVSFLQADIAYFILGPLCSVALTLHDRVRINALSLIADVIAIELYSFGELSHVQHALLSTLDRLVMSENKGDDLICSKITIELANAIEKRLLTDNRRDLLIFGRRAVDSICRFLSLLLQIRSLPADDEFMDERITATLKLMKFIQVIEREEIYIKYVHQLVQLHLDSRNFIEAALTMRFHADLLQWDPSDKLIDIPELGLPIQSSFSRKEALYSKMITYLDQGSAWELCIELCKELAYEYENTIYDYNKLSDILQRQASLTENIVKKERYYTEYFRVGFYGRGFPASNRNRQYIYRGLEWEKMSSFVERMQNRHPNAQLLPSKMSNSMTITDEQLKELDSALDGQYLQITPVTAIADVDLISCLSNPNTPESIKKYYSFNNVSKFSFSRPIVKENDPSDKPEDKPESEVLNLWTEKIEFICEDRFPTIVRRSKIVSSHSQLISPIENAVLAMENKNKELMALDKKYSAYIPRGNRRAPVLSQPININPFSMSLNGAVDAPVNGGVPLYKRAFLTKEYWDKNPEMHHWIDRLQMAIYDQVRVIQKCLETHNKLVSSEMRPFHTTLTEFFHKNFAEEIKFIKENHLKQEQQKDKQLLSIVTQSNNRRRSTLSSNATENSSTHSHQHALQQQPLEDMKPMSLASSRQGSTSLASTIQAPGRVNTPALPQIPTMSPISRAFSISTPVADPLSLSGSNAYHSTAFENATMSRAESLSRTLKMSLKKKSRKKSQSSSNSTNTMNSNNTANSIIHKP
ncbi:Dedicator of cytokinesis protein 3 [Choanephora cucurbitarum]|uniref:Dedicator of cytokinesis protein 3 n=1 Tax=Choanephora cucurbitarum TaxID=101091 RepID=A0A1C7NNS9_9FUNG|nr:Dedicator of cytokinesis protein 3 [Choanephora cucurbitarum]